MRNKNFGNVPRTGLCTHNESPTPKLDGIASENVGTPHAILPRRVFLRRAAEAIKVPAQAHILESQIAQEGEELCLRQSTGDSTRPQINVAAHILAKFAVDDNIG